MSSLLIAIVSEHRNSKLIFKSKVATLRRQKECFNEAPRCGGLQEEIFNLEFPGHFTLVSERFSVSNARNAHLVGKTT